MTKLKLLKPIKNYSFEIDTVEGLSETFSEKDLRKVILPSKWVFPLRTQHFLTWTSPDGMYAYLVFKKPEWNKPRGVVFRGRNTGGAQPAAMCDWCHAFGGSDEIGLLLTSVNSKKTVGMMLCLDLGCVEKTETLAMLAGKSFEKLAEKICDNVAGFYEHILKSE